MTFRKPYRICNKANPAACPAPLKSGAVTATLKELKDRYELRVWIPGSEQHDHFLSISEGLLYVYQSRSASSEKDVLLACFVLPANVQQDKVVAFCRKYGIKIIMPVAPLNGVVISIPVLQEQAG
ncbi:hypothetical protein [Taibaiella helva]|uniref:hypothetical protein n=1 Tax=Taibaiella helva TaxID=2301235 RepID=UPI000E5892B5|nr:hypothetical protein [Taibaiella helva]